MLTKGESCDRICVQACLSTLVGRMFITPTQACIERDRLLLQMESLTSLIRNYCTPRATTITNHVDQTTSCNVNATKRNVNASEHLATIRETRNYDVDLQDCSRRRKGRNAEK